MRSAGCGASAPGGKDAVEQISADRNLGKLEGNGAGVADDPRAGFDQSCLEAGQKSKAE